jgi:hypothetical protein
VVVPERNKPYVLAGITLEFFGEQHATIVPTYPVAQNMGVLVNEQLYYPGDSFTECPKSYTVLAVPTFAPWLKYAEVAEFVGKSPAQKVFPMHNGFLNDDGNALFDRLLGGTCQQLGKDYQFIAAGESIEL